MPLPLILPRQLAPSLIDRIAEEVEAWAERVGSANGCMHLLSTDRTRLICQAVTNGYRATRLAHGLSIQESEGAQRALATGKVVVVEESIGSGLVARVAAEVYGLRACLYVPIQANGASVCEGVLIFAQGHPHAWSAAQIETAQQAGVAMAGLLTERLARSSPEEPHTQAERRLRGLLDAAPGLLAAIDRDFIIYEANGRQGVDLQGDPLRGSIIVRHLRDSPRRAEVEQAIEDLHSGNRGRASFLLEVGSSSVQVDLVPLYGERGVEGVGLACTDLTDALKAKQMLADSQRMMALGQIAARVAHEFNNILQAVSVSAELLELEQGVAAEHLVELNQAVERGAKLASELLSFSRVNPPSFRETSLVSAVSSHWKLLQNAVGREHPLVLVVRSSLSTPLDAGQVQLALLNLCINARDASKAGSVIEAIVDEQRHKGQLFATLTVADQGHGMTAEVRARALEAFFTTKPRGRGTGLGLASVKSTVDAHRGWMSIDSAEGKGTRVTLAFPVKSAPAAAASSQPPPVTSPKTSGRRVLVVEDEPAIGRFFETILLREGHEVRRASTVQEALTLLRQEPAWPGLVLLDMTLPDGSGRTVFEAIAPERPDLRFLVCTGFAEQSDTAVILAAGHSLLAKPASASRLIEAVRARLADPAPA